MTDEQQKPNVVPDVVRLPLLYPIPDADIRISANLAYRSEGEVQLHADVYAPPRLSSGERRAVVLLVHGGPVPAVAHPKDWQVFRDYGRLIAASGLVAVTFNHRLHAPTDYFTAQSDVAMLIDYVRAHAKELSVDPDKVILWVFSGGGPLLTVGLDPQRTYLRGLVVYYGLLDFELLGNPETRAVPREILDRLSPLAQLRQHGCSVPILLARAGKESFPGLNTTIDAFMAETLSKGVNVELINHAGGEHAFDVRNDDARTREIIARTLSFLRERAE